MKPIEKLNQFGTPALTTTELLEIIKYKGDPGSYYESMHYIVQKELVRRKEVAELPQIRSSKHIFAHMSFMQVYNHEEFWIMCLNRAHKVVNTIFISKGGSDATIADPSIIIRKAVENKTRSLILVHNHPSGQLMPSENDKLLTTKLKSAANLFDIYLLDHVIVSQSGYYSFADEGVL